METSVIIEKQDLTYLKWSHTRNSSGTAGTFLKSQEIKGGKKVYYKLSLFDSEKGIIGHECVNEIIVDRLLTILGVEHLHYNLIHADVEIEGKVLETWLCASEDFKSRGETKTALDGYYQANSLPGESHYYFCVRNGWEKYIDVMIVVDYLIMNRDRHGANIEVLRNARKKTLRIAPLFDHGLSLLCSCHLEEEIVAFDVMKDMPCQNFIGSRSSLDNLKLIQNKNGLFHGSLTIESKAILFGGLKGVISQNHMDKIWDMIYSRWCYYESLCNS